MGMPASNTSTNTMKPAKGTAENRKGREKLPFMSVEAVAKEIRIELVTGGLPVRVGLGKV
jgi:hypothetical protein